MRNVTLTASGQAGALLARWREVRLGIHLVLLGHFLFLSLAVPGLILLGLCFAQHGNWMVNVGVMLPRPDAMTLGNLMVLVGAMPGYGLLLMGQWRCLTYSPPKHGARAFMYFSVLCLLVGPTCLIAASYLGEQGSLLTLGGLAALETQTLLTLPALLQFGSALLLLANVALFSLFQRAVHLSLYPDRSRRSLIVYCWFVGFLVGATIGLFWGTPREVVGGLAAGWVLSLIWHIVLVGRTSRAIRQARSIKPGHQPADAMSRPKPYSGLHRYYIHSKPR